MYYLANKAGKKLSAFHSNDIKPKLLFRKNDWIIFSTVEEACNYLNYILSYGVGKNLEIIKNKEKMFNGLTECETNKTKSVFGF